MQLNDAERLPYLDDLIQRKLVGAEQERLTDADLAFHRGEYTRLRGRLQEAFEKSALRETASIGGDLHDLLVRIRMNGQ